MGCAGLMTGAAQAGVEICNEGARLQSVAIGYESPEGDWVSEGWWQIAPGACKTVMARALGRRDLYYRATSGDGFDGPFGFCTQSAAFTITGDQDCAGRGYERNRFRKVDTGGNDPFRLTLGADGDALAEAPKSDAGGAPRRLSTAYTPGAYGEPITVNALFNGCTRAEEGEYCSFVDSGFRYHAYYGPNPDPLLDALLDWPVNLPVRVRGDVTQYGDITAEIQLGSVVERPGGDPFAQMRADLQGAWRSADDPASEFRVLGSDIYDLYGGELVAEELMDIAPHCDEAPGLGLGFIRTDLETQQPWCVLIDTIRPDFLRFTNPGRGNFIEYYKAE
jgi:uncharacterized membrane protein